MDGQRIIFEKEQVDKYIGYENYSNHLENYAGNISGDDFVEKPNSEKIYNRYVKRIIDIFLSLFFILIAVPLLIVVMAAVFIDSGLPIFYRAPRGGFNDKPFKIYKFRTMVKDADKFGSGTTALNDSRITKVGAVLRKTKIDEIPQLFNILKGEMSFVGPRPELLKYTQRYEGAEKSILKVRPGITDYSSIKFINLDEIVGEENVEENYEKYILKEKKDLRVKYATEVSFYSDVKIFFITTFKTIKKAIKYIFKSR